MAQIIQCSEIKNIQKLTTNQETMCKEVKEIKNNIQKILDNFEDIKTFILTAPQNFITKQDYKEEKENLNKQKENFDNQINNLNEFKNKINLKIAFISGIWATVMFIIALIMKIY